MPGFDFVICSDCEFLVLCNSFVFIHKWHISVRSCCRNRSDRYINAEMKCGFPTPLITCVTCVVITSHRFMKMISVIAADVLCCVMCCSFMNLLRDVYFVL